MRSSAGEERESDNDDGEGEKKAIFEIEGVTLHYTQEVGNMICRRFCRGAH